MAPFRTHRSGQSQAPSVAGISNNAQVNAFSLTGDVNVNASPAVNGNQSNATADTRLGFKSPAKTNTHGTSRKQQSKENQQMTKSRTPNSKKHQPLRKCAIVGCLVGALVGGLQPSHPYEF